METNDSVIMKHSNVSHGEITCSIPASHVIESHSAQKLHTAVLWVYSQQRFGSLFNSWYIYVQVINVYNLSVPAVRIFRLYC